MFRHFPDIHGTVLDGNPPQRIALLQVKELEYFRGDCRPVTVGSHGDRSLFNADDILGD